MLNNVSEVKMKVNNNYEIRKSMELTKSVQVIYFYKAIETEIGEEILKL